MSSKQEDENYWNRSDFKPFSFDDEEFQLGNQNRLLGNTVSPSLMADIIFEGVVRKPEPIKKPLETLISKDSLSKILGENLPSRATTKLSAEEELKILRRQVNNQWVPPSVSKTIKLILTGQPYSLHLYKSLTLKKDLLDEAIKSGDGNAITAIVLFLSNTLKKSIFYQILQSRPGAVSHYIQYLTSRIMVSQLIDLLEMLGQPRDAAMKQFTFIVQGIQNTETKLQRLNACYNNHFSLLNSTDKHLVNDYIQYFQWMLTLESSTFKCSLENSVLSSLTYLCKNHWDEAKNSKTSPWFLSSQQKVTDRQVQWIILTSRASLQSWDDIETHFLTKGWISGKKLKGNIPAEKIIVNLHKNEAPYSVLAQYFDIISSIEKRLDLAKQLLCHKAVIDTYVLMKDRRGIMEYKMNLKPQSEEYLHAENVLRCPVKWKN